MAFSPLSQTIKIFFSYAISSATDRRLCKKLQIHLSTLRRLHLIDEWYDSAISAGSTINQAVESHLREAQIIVLLISAEFVNSDRCYELEMQRALEFSAAGTARLIPVLLSPTDWEVLPLKRFRALPANGTAVSLWRNREDALLEVARGIRKVVEELAGRAARILTHTVTPPLPFRDFPYRQNDFFTDREAIFAALASSLPFTQTRQTSILALYGLGGMGKTQIALEYLYRSSQLYQISLWLDASSRAVLSTEVSALAERLALPAHEYKDEDQLFTAVKRWLHNQPKTWLLVLDHVDDDTPLDLLVPPQSNGHVLLTTRAPMTGRFASAIPITQMDTAASVLFLLQRAGIIPVKASIDLAPPEAIQEATAIARAMDGFPLALDQAGAYLEETGCGLTAYLALFQQERAALLNRRGRLVHKQNHPDSVMITLTLTIEKVKQQRATNLHLLRLLAFLHPEAIPYELLLDGAGELSEPLRSLATRSLALNEALADLHSYSLVHYLADTTTLRIHRIVQAILTDTLTTRQKRHWASQVVRMVNRVFPEVTFDNWARCKRYLPQAQHCATLISAFKLTLKEGALLLQRLGSYCYRQACYTEAETYLSQALHLHEQQQEADALATARTLNALALLFYRQARYAEAEQTHLRALELRTQTLGPDHLDTAESLHNLALLYGQQGNYQQAEQFYLRVLSLEEQALGPEHPTTAKTLNNLGLLYYEQGDYQQAEAAYQRALTIYERATLTDHPDAMYPLDGLGALAEKRADYQQAEEFYQRALAICEQALGDAHPETAHSLNKLADIYETQDKDQQAEALYQRALTLGTQALGPNHPDSALFLNNLAFLADKQGKSQQAEDYYQRALSIYEQTLGTEHPLVADVLNNLGMFYLDRQNEERAEELLRRALAIRTQALGSTHPATAQSLSNLADLLSTRHMYEKAERLFQQAFALRLQTFGPTHPDVTRTREKYAALLEQLHRNEEAAILRQTAHMQEEHSSAEQAQDDH